MSDTTPRETASRVSERRKYVTRQAVDKDLSHLDHLAVEYVGINLVYPNPDNPNKMTTEEFELLVLSIRRSGFTRPILVNADGMIIDGEHRWLAAHTVGYTEIPVVRVSMGEIQRKIATLRHNKARGAHDVVLEAEIFKGFRELGHLDYLADSLGTTEEVLDELIAALSGPDPLTPSTSLDAWIPAAMPADQAQLIEGNFQELEIEGEPLRAHTSEAVAYHKRQQQRLEALTNEDDRVRFRARMRKTEYQLKLVYLGDDGELVEEVLGDKPAERLLDLCIEGLGVEGVTTAVTEFFTDYSWESYDEYLELRERYTGARYGVELPVLKPEEIKLWPSA